MTQTPIQTFQTSLYEYDFSLWLEGVAAKLKARDFDNLDLDNLIEEIEDLGKSLKRSLQSRLQELFEHILKRCYIPMPENYRGWVESIQKQRIGIRKLIAENPSLKPYFDHIFDETYADALSIVREGYPEYQLPQIWQFSHDLEFLLTVKYWEDQQQ